MSHPASNTIARRHSAWLSIAPQGKATHGTDILTLPFTLALATKARPAKGRAMKKLRIALAVLALVALGAGNTLAMHQQIRLDHPVGGPPAHYK